MNPRRNTCDKCASYTAATTTIYAPVSNNGECARMTYSGDGPTPVDGVTAWDAESYNAGCYVGPKFGCIHFTRKKDTA